MNGSHYSTFTLGSLILFGVSIFFSFDPIFAQVEIPGSPIDLEADVVSSTQIDLSWSEYDDVNTSVTGYKIETRINTDSDYSVVVEDTGNTDTEFSHTDLIPGSIYAYRVSAINPDGISEPSSSKTVKTSVTNSSDSDVPTNVKIKAISQNSAELTWDPPTQTYGQTIQNYMIKQELTAGVYENIANTSDSDTKYTVSDLSTGQIYVFVVTANYALGSSDNSNEVKITLNSSSVNSDSNTDNGDITTPDDVPDRPTDLEAKAISSTKIDLSWDAPDDDKSDNNAAVTGYKIEGKEITDSRYDVIVEDTKSKSTKYSHTGLDEDTDYVYRVSAINSEGESDESSEARTKTLSSDDDNGDITTPDDVPDRPTDLEAKAISSTKIDLSWDAPDDDKSDNNAAVTGYKIEGKEITDSRYDVIVEDTKSKSTKYSHTGLDEDTDYVYRVSAINSEGESDESSEARTKTLSSDDDNGDITTPDDVPDRPTDLEAKAISSTKIDLSWDAPDDDKSDNNAAVTGYKIEGKEITDSRYDVIVEDTKSKSTKYSHTGLDEDTDYVYRVSAINSEGESDESSEARTKTLSSDDDNGDITTPDDVPDRPTDLEAKAISSTKIDLSWDAPDDDKSDNNAAVTGYKIEGKEITDSRYDVIVEDTKSKSTKYSHTGLDEDTDYVYRVSAINSEGESDESSEARTKTLSSDDDNGDITTPDDVPDRPTDLEAKAISSTKIDLSWDAPDDDKSDNNAAVTGYKIEGKEITDSRYDVIVEDTKSKSTKYSHTGLDEDTDYVYRVSAINSEGESDESSEARTKTLSSDNTSQQSSPTSDNTSQQSSPTSDNTSQQSSPTSDNTSQQSSPTSDNTSQQSSPTSDNTSQQSSPTSDNTSQQSSPTSDNTSQQSSPTSDNTSQQSSPTSEDFKSINDVKNASIKAFSNIVDPEKDPQYYVDRYNNEPAYRDWFDKNFSEITIYEALNIENPDLESTSEPISELALFVDPEKDPQYYVDRYNNEPAYRDWFDKNYSQYSSIYQAVGLNNSVDQNEIDSIKCGSGTERVGDICVVLKTQEKPWWQFW